ncbi:hypothetical protein ACPC54_30550 [Kitasatospora sp. NPDC094028]
MAFPLFTDHSIDDLNALIRAELHAIVGDAFARAVIPARSDLTGRYDLSNITLHNREGRTVVADYSEAPFLEIAVVALADREPAETGGSLTVDL